MSNSRNKGCLKLNFQKWTYMQEARIISKSILDTSTHTVPSLGDIIPWLILITSIQNIKICFHDSGLNKDNSWCWLRLGLHYLVPNLYTISTIFLDGTQHPKTMILRPQIVHMGSRCWRNCVEYLVGNYVTTKFSVRKWAILKGWPVIVTNCYRNGLFVLLKTSVMIYRYFIVNTWWQL